MSSLIPDPTAIATPQALPTAAGLGEILNNTYSTLLPVLLIFLGIVAVVGVMWAGFQYLVAQGDPKAAEAAKARILNVVYGVLVLALGTTVIGLLIGLLRWGIGQVAN